MGLFSRHRGHRGLELDDDVMPQGCGDEDEERKAGRLELEQKATADFLKIIVYYWRRTLLVKPLDEGFMAGFRCEILRVISRNDDRYSCIGLLSDICT